MTAATVAVGRRRAAAIIVRHSLREATRRRVLVVVGGLTVAFLVLFALGTSFAFDEDSAFTAGTLSIRDRALTGATLMGLAMFATLFLGAVLATFLTMGVVRGDAESGMLQPLVARPAERTTILLGRLGGAALISAAFVILVFCASSAIVGAIGDWSPDRPVQAALLLALAVAAVAIISLLASVWLSATAQGIAVLMIYGGGLTAGLLGQIGETLDSERLVDVSTFVSWALPFEALYLEALAALVADTGGIAQIVIDLGPFGGGRSGGLALLAWVVLYFAGTIAVAAWGFARRDL